MITNNMNYEQAVDSLDAVISDCASPDWDTQDCTNWESLVTLLEEIKTYIILEHVRKTV